MPRRRSRRPRRDAGFCELRAGSDGLVLVCEGEEPQHVALGRLSPKQRRAYAARRLVTPEEAIERVRARSGLVDLSRLPSHVRGYAAFMAQASQKPVSARDLGKAYVITRSSVQRQARKRPKVCEVFPEYAELRYAARQAGYDDVRPEDAMSVLLFSEPGQRYLDALEEGRFDGAAADEIVRRMKCFGLTATLRKDLEKAVRVAHDEGLRSALRSASAEDWLALVDSPRVPGIGPAKAGFIAALLGRGDLPTFDAREIKLWRRKHGGADPKQTDVLALRDAIARFPMELTPAQEPFRQHLVHHALWDAYPDEGRPTRTTHASVVHAMQLAGLRGRGLGWLWPPQPCGLPYEKFRAGFTFKDAYDWLAFGRDEHGRSHKPSQKKIVNQLARMKREAYEQYIASCDAERGGAPPAKTWSSCDRVCKVKSKPCGKACISKKRNCRKEPGPRTCSIEEFQQSLPFEKIAQTEAEEARRAEERAADWEEHRAIFGEQEPGEDEVDTSFDFQGLGDAARRRAFGVATVKHGGAAVGRGHYRPLPAGASAVTQYREVEAARARIIEAIESGKFELCPKGAQPGGGSRTASEWAAVRERMRRAGY